MPSSAANNNGSAFAGLGAARHSGTCCWRFACCRPFRGHRAGDGYRRFAGGKKIQPTSSGTLATHDALFIGLLIGTVLLVGALTFIPALALGPLAEHFSLL
jgi:K+-transporting ATPase ATPase A chain